MRSKDDVCVSVCVFLRLCGCVIAPSVCFKEFVFLCSSKERSKNDFSAPTIKHDIV